MNKSSFTVHKVEFVVEAGPQRGHCGCVAQHADRPFDGCHIATLCSVQSLIIDANFESSGTPVHEMNVCFGFDFGDGVVDISWSNIATI